MADHRGRKNECMCDGPNLRKWACPVSRRKAGYYRRCRFDALSSYSIFKEYPDTEYFRKMDSIYLIDELYDEMQYGVPNTDDVLRKVIANMMEAPQNNTDDVLREMT